MAFSRVNYTKIILSDLINCVRVEKTLEIVRTIEN